MKKIMLFVLNSILIFAGVSAKADDSPSTIHILFIGNSYTFVNNMPEMLRQISLSDHDNPQPIETAMVAKGGATLLDMWNDSGVQTLFHKGHWNFVVLQEQSEWAMFPAAISNTATALAKWKDAISLAGAAPIFYVTWQRKPGSDWYTKVPQLQNPDYMQQQIMHYVDTIVTPLNIPAVPIGSYWIMATAAYPSIELYASDGSHPSAAGSYLTALVFYHYFTHRPLDKISYHPEQVSDTDAQSLKEIASQ